MTGGWVGATSWSSRRLRATAGLGVVVGLMVGCGDSPTRPADVDPTEARLPPPPLLRDDGWPVTVLSEAGFVEDSIVALVSGVEAGRFGAVRSVLIARRGQLAFEWYGRGGAHDVRHALQSVTKSVAGLLVGIAEADGALARTDLLPDLLPGHGSLMALDPRKSDVHLEHLLDMRAGIEWDEWSCGYTEACNDARRMNHSIDWIDFVLSRPIVEEPGDRFVYSTGVSVLLGEILREATLEDPAAYAAERLFGPLGINDVGWLRQRGPDDLPHLGGGLHLRSRDLLKIGQLVADGGMWNGRRVVPGEWIETMITDPPPATLLDAYRAQWWMRALRGVDGYEPADNDVVFASGYGGQHVFVVRRLGLVVATTAQNEDGSSLGPQILAAVARALSP